MKNTNKKILAIVIICLSFFAVNRAFADGANMVINNLKYRATHNSNLDGIPGYEEDSLESFDILADVIEDADSGTISTTYDMSGYSSFLKVGDNEKIANFSQVNSLDDVTLSMNIQESSTEPKVIVTYLVKNNSDATKEVSVASAADIDIGRYLCDPDDAECYEAWEDGNDKAAVVRAANQEGFIVTQDDDSECGYGLSLNIGLSPRGTSTWIGDYHYGDVYYYDNRYVSGDIDSITYGDKIDSALAYSWSNSLQPGETKTYTVTFSADVLVESNIEYYAYDNFDDSYITKTAIIGGALEMPLTTGPLTKGYNYKWNSERDGSGYKAIGGSIIIYDGTNAFYEFKYKNGVILPDGKDEDDPLKTIAMPDDDAMDEYLQEAEDTYGDVEIEIDIDIITQSEIINDLVNEDNFDMTAVLDDENPSALLQASIKKITIDETGARIEEDIYDPTKISVILPEEMTEKYNVFRIMSIDFEEGKLVLEEADYDEETNRLEFVCNPYEVYTIMGSYIEVPDTGFLVVDDGASSGIILATITATASISAYYYICVYRKQKPIILDR